MNTTTVKPLLPASWTAPKPTPEDALALRRQISDACQRGGCNWFSPGNQSGEIGHADFYGDNQAMIAALQMLGVKVTNYRAIDDVPVPFERADLLDADDTRRGTILLGKDGRGSADLSYALTSPLLCFAIVR